MSTLILVRHGQSLWNLENKFTGWVDVDLSPQGEREALKAGGLIKQAGIKFDVAFCSVLRRAVRTLHLIERASDIYYTDEFKNWRLNERHYGALQGLNKAETAKKYGQKQVQLWRRSFDIRPPRIDIMDERAPHLDPLYMNIEARFLPLGESLKDTATRVVSYWQEAIAPALAHGKNTIVVAHGNSLRAMLKFLRGIPDADIPSLEIPTGVPIILNLNADLRVTKDYTLI